MTKPEGIIWIFIICLILMFFGYLGRLIYISFFYKEGYQDDLEELYNRFKGITNICAPYDADYNAPYCIYISFSDYNNKVRSIKAILDPGYGVDPDTGFVTFIGNAPPTAIYTNKPIIIILKYLTKTKFRKKNNE